MHMRIVRAAEGIEDRPRQDDGTAPIGDPRNDENLIVSQLQLAFLRFHNRVVADVTADLGPRYTAGEIFAEETL